MFGDLLLVDVDLLNQLFLIFTQQKIDMTGISPYLLDFKLVLKTLCMKWGPETICEKGKQNTKLLNLLIHDSQHTVVII